MAHPLPRPLEFPRIELNFLGSTYRQTAKVAAVPTICRKKPFGENVEGLSHFSDESCAVERAVQTHNIEQPTFCSVERCKPFCGNGLKKFKHFHRQVGRCVVRAVQNRLSCSALP